MFNNYEDDRNEFKEIINDKMEREIIAFLNHKGGNLYIGVNDCGNVVGVKEDLDKFQLEIKNRIKNNILPTTLGLFDINIQEYDEKKIIRIGVASGNNKPYYLKKIGMIPSGCFIRVGSSVEPLSQDKIDALFSRRIRTSLCDIVSPKQDLLFSELKIYYEEKGYTINNNFFKQLNLIMEDGKFNYLAYLLADNNNISIKVGTYSGEDAYDLMKNEEYGNCSLIKVTNRVMEKFEIINDTYTKITGSARRKELQKFDRIAVREVIINAMVHNLWETQNPPKFEIFSDHIAITSSGGLVQGIDKEGFLKGYSLPRYPELMRVFKDLGLVEQLGTGIIRILKVYSKDVYEFGNNFIRVNFKYRSPLELEDKTMIISRDVSKVQNEILNLIGDDKYITQAELSKIIGKGRSTIASNLKILKTSGYLKRVGSDKNGFWKIL